MRHNFLNWSAALQEMENSKSYVVLGALTCLHSGMMDCAGDPMTGAVSRRRLPAHALDLVWYYRAVGKIVENWSQLECPGPESHLTDKLGSDSVIAAFDDAGRAALSKFAKALHDVSRTDKVDEEFCCWLFAETIVARGLLNRVLDGSIGREKKELETSGFDTWAAKWT